MNTLADLLNFVVSTLQTSPQCVSMRVLETHQFSESQFALKVRAEMKSGNTLQVRLYCNREHIDYAYQLLNGDKPLVRWDNKEHFSSIPSQPHHFHDESNQVTTSVLTGDPNHDLPIVLKHIESH